LGRASRGTNTDAATGIARSGSAIYVAGTVANSATNGSKVQFGSTSLPGNGSSANGDVFVARLSDGTPTMPPTWQWVLQGGGSGSDQASALAVSGSTLYVSGLVTPAATFGPTALTEPAGQPAGLLSMVQDAQPFPVTLKP
jgi:hypothetical protein